MVIHDGLESFLAVLATFIVLAFIFGGIIEKMKEAKKKEHEEKLTDLSYQKQLIDAQREVEIAKRGGPFRTEDAYGLALGSATHKTSIVQERDKIELRIYERSEMTALDVEKEREEINTAVNAAMRLKLAPDHELLEVQRLLLEQHQYLQTCHPSQRLTHRAALNHFKARFNELCKRPVQKSNGAKS